MDDNGGDTAPRRGMGRRVFARAFRIVLQPPLERVDPSLRLLRHRVRAVPTPPLAVVGVYRRAFAHEVRAVRECLPAGTQLALWGLDGVDEVLAADTLGSGPGQRFALHNRLLAALDLPSNHWVLAMDDDVRFKRGTPEDLARAAVHSDLELSQPAHAWNSQVSHRYTRRRMLMLTRRTGFVEMGPAVLFSPHARERVLPWPEDLHWPGWGVEWLWNREEQRGLKLGIVDAVTIRHVHPVAASGYSVRAAKTQDEAMMRHAGFEPGFNRYVDRAHWRPWHPDPPRATPALNDAAI